MSQGGFSEAPEPYRETLAGLSTVARVPLKVDSAGRVVIPSEMRTAMRIKPGDIVSARVIDGELRILSGDVALERVRAHSRSWRARNTDTSAVDELIADRREEARREDERYARLDREAADARETDRK
jgi:AbrB family looped-hinge helix DNA binding protein